MRKLFNKFSFKVLGLALAIVFTAQAVTIITVLRFADVENDRIAREKLKQASAGFTHAMEHRSKALTDIIYSVTSYPDVIEAVRQNRSKDRVMGVIQSAMVQAKAAVAVLYDADGNIHMTFGIDAQDRQRFAELPRKQREIVLLTLGAVEMAVLPVDQDDPVGWLAMGYKIDDNIAGKMGINMGVDISILRTRNTGKVGLLASSLPTKERELVHTIVGEMTDGKSHDEALEEMLRHFTTAATRYFADDKQVLVLIHKRVAEVRRPFLALRRAMLHATGVSVVGALLLAMLMSRSVTTPIRQLLMAARHISVGNYSKKLAIKTDDEFGELAKAFETMRKGIADREQRIVYQAEFDSLTGLPNRLHSMTLLREALRIASKNDTPVVVMVMHLQRFREVQSSLGHEIGDEVLRQTAQRMRSALNDSHILARLEGDQFLIVASNTDKDEGKRLARRLAGMLDAGLNVQSVNVTLDACIGFCVSPEHGRQPDELLRRAAVAKNDAQQGQKRIRIYQSGREARNVRQLAILGDLRRATRENEMELYLQPKVALQNTQVCGAEALARWNHPELGPIAPGEFIPLAEHAGCIGMITEWMLGRAVAQARSLKNQGINLPIAVNLSAQDLLGENLIGLIEQELESNKMDASCLTLEITEEALVHDLEYAVKVLERLRQMGAKTSMDDFGTGYSSLGHLQQMPVDELKIDRTFISNLPDHQQNAAIVRAVIDMAHNLGLEVVAEGVETTAALRWLREEGCEQAQGYYVSKPMPADEFAPWMRRWESPPQDDLLANADMTDSPILRPRLIT